MTSGDILDEQADVLVCSANPFLTLSGGVGGAFLLRYGDEMQQRLNEYLAKQGVRHVPPGTVVQTPPCGSPYMAVLHAVAVDGMYESSSDCITQTTAAALEIAEQIGAASIALPALATGYGRLTMRQFAEGLIPLLDRPSSLSRIVVRLLREDDADVVRATLGLDQR